MRAPALRVSQRRLRVVQAGILLALAALGLRAVELALDPRSLQRARAQQGAWLRLAPERGEILDRTGETLALSVEAPSIFARPTQVGDPEATARALARVLGGEPRSLASRLGRDSRFVFLARWVEPGVAERVRELELPGVDVVMEPRRAYPHRELAAQVLGFANIDGEGVRGIEQREDGWLRGSPRVYRVERDARGEILGIAGVRPTAARGGDVRLTLDAGFQADAEEALAGAVERTGARGGILLTLDPWSGEILALAERPTYDPNRFRRVEYRRTRSRAFQDALEPGSSLKPFLVASALEAGAVRPDEPIDTGDGTLRVPGKVIRDLHPEGPLRPAGVLRVSSNVGAVRIAQALGRREHFAGLRAFGFGERSGSGFPSESAGLLRPWQDWRPVDHATVAFGQGLSVTAVQMALATAALANGGLLLEPRLVAARRRPGGEWGPTGRTVRRRALSPDTARAVRRMLEAVVGPEGTARRASLRGVSVAGKTGTAQKLDPASGTYSTTRYHAWFVGVVPADEPRLVIVAQLDEPRLGLHHGGSSAAPLFAEAASAHLARLGIATEPGPVRPEAAPIVVASAPPRQTEAAGQPRPAPRLRSVAETREQRVSVTRIGNRILLPDFRGLTVEEVVEITREASLAVEVVGDGRAIAQDPQPGTILAGPEGRVRVHFSPTGGRG